MPVLGLRVPLKEITEVQKKLGDHLVIIPRFKCVQNIEEDATKKAVLMKKEADNSAIEVYAKEKGYELVEQEVTLTYDNLSMSNLQTS